MALLLVQVQLGMAQPPSVILLTLGAQQSGRYVSAAAHAASAWGLARSARVEAQLPVLCFDGRAAEALELEARLAEPEIVLRPSSRLVPRLAHAPTLGEPAIQT